MEYVIAATLMAVVIWAAVPRLIPQRIAGKRRSTDIGQRG